MALRVCACGCGREFEPSKYRPDQKYYSKYCKWYAFYYLKGGKARRKQLDKENREKINLYTKRYNRQLKEEMIKAYGGACECCGENTFEFLTIDHVDGRKKEQTQKGVQMYLWLRKHGWPRNGFRLLCSNCNSAIGFYGYCPHKKVI